MYQSLQSSGKSSVLEALSGIPFPRGSGLVTRCPIRLVMRKARVGEFWNATVSTSIDPHARFPVTEVNALSVVINKLTETLCSRGSTGFSTDQIVVELVSPDACDLTVVDLPGIIRTVTTGQSVNVIEQVNKLIQNFLSDPRTIILAVIPANQDIATVDILERALYVDPSGERTVGVLTKIDLIGPGAEEEVLAVVNNVRKPLALGYIMVKNRSQKDLNSNVSTVQARENESDYFKNHSVFRNCDPKLYGVQQLSKKLTLLLVSRIQREFLPIRQEVENRLNDVRAEIRAMSSTTYMMASHKTPADRQKLLVSVMQEYMRHLTDGVRGEYRDRLMIKHADLRLYTRVLASFDSFQLKVLSSAPNFKSDEFIKNLSVQIEHLRGKELPGFLSSQAFSMCMSNYVDQWRQPMNDMLMEAQEKAQDVAAKLSDTMLVQYPVLKETLRKVAAQVLIETADEVTRRLMDNLYREKDPFTMNDFLQQWVNKLRYDRFTHAVDLCFDHSSTPAANWNGLKEEVFNKMRSWYIATHSVSSMASAQEMSAILEAYWNLSAKRFIDNCCMTVDREILGKLTSNVQDKMYQFLKDDKQLSEFFSEDSQFVQKRDNAEKKRDLLVQASSVLSSIRMTAAINSIPLSSSSSKAPQQAAAAISQSGAKSSILAPNPPPKVVKASPTGTTSGPAGKLLNIAVNVGANGIGIIVVDGDDNKMAVKGFRKDIMPNPSADAGVMSGDVIEMINGITPQHPEEAVNLLRNAKGRVILTVTRK